MQIDYAIASSTERTQKSSRLKAYNAQKLTERDLDHVQSFIEHTDYDGHVLDWAELCTQFGFDVYPQTLRNRMAARSIFTFVTASKPFVDEQLAALRVQWAKTMLTKYPLPIDWRHIRFSDEVHFGWGPEGRQLIIRPRGSDWRGHPSCIQRKETRDKKDQDQTKRVHFWGAVGYEFKSELVQYSVPGNSNGKITHKVYIQQILEPVVAEWCLEKKPWCLEEDGDSGHGLIQNSNVVEKWKKAHSMSRDSSTIYNYYANCPQSPDFAVIEDLWQYPKQYVRKRPHWDDEVVAELAQEAWTAMPQEWINRLVDSMPQRLQDCIDSKGQLVEMRRPK